MITLAWMAVLIPLTLLGALLVAVFTEGYRDWSGFLIVLSIAGIIILLGFSMFWGSEYIKNHSPSEKTPVQAERQ